VLLGTIYGVCGGVLLALLRRTRFIRLAGGPSLFGFCMFGSAWASSAVGRSTATTAPVPEPAVWYLAALCFVGYGVLASSLAARWCDAGE
jgi:hypothetical protein